MCSIAGADGLIAYDWCWDIVLRTRDAGSANLTETKSGCEDAVVSTNTNNRDGSENFEPTTGIQESSASTETGLYHDQENTLVDESQDGWLKPEERDEQLDIGRERRLVEERRRKLEAQQHAIKEELRGLEDRERELEVRRCTNIDSSRV